MQAFRQGSGEGEGEGEGEREKNGREAEGWVSRG